VDTSQRRTKRSEIRLSWLTELTDCAVEVDEELPTDVCIRARVLVRCCVCVFPAAAVPAIEESLLSQLRGWESGAIALAEGAQAAARGNPAPAGAYTESLRLLDCCIEACPSYASAHNNRAQVLQLERGPDFTARAMAACDAAILHANAAGERTVLAQAYTQRGLLHRTLDHAEEALADLERGAKLGNAFAKTEAVRLNPYAALCNQYLQAALDKHWSGLGAPAAVAPAEGGACSASSAGAACDAAPKQ